MDSKLLVRLGAAVFVALAIVASAVELTRKPDDPIRGQPSASAASDASLRDELLRCQLVGNLPLPPKECLDAWIESRRRFLGGDPSASLPVRTTPPVTTPNSAVVPSTVTPPTATAAGQAAPRALGQGH